MTLMKCLNQDCGHTFETRKEATSTKRRCPKCATTRVEPFESQDKSDLNIMLRDDNPNEKIIDLDNDPDIRALLKKKRMKELQAEIGEIAVPSEVVQHVHSLEKQVKEAANQVNKMQDVMMGFDNRLKGMEGSLMPHIDFLIRGRVKKIIKYEDLIPLINEALNRRL